MAADVGRSVYKLDADASLSKREECFNESEVRNCAEKWIPGARSQYVKVSCL